VHGVCRRRAARRHGELLDRLRGEVALDLSLSHVRVQRRGEFAVLEHRERDGALSTETEADPLSEEAKGGGRAYALRTRIAGPFATDERM
jgi:hypothetical protein